MFVVSHGNGWVAAPGPGPVPAATGVRSCTGYKVTPTQTLDTINIIKRSPSWSELCWHFTVSLCVAPRRQTSSSSQALKSSRISVSILWNISNFDSEYPWHWIFLPQENLWASCAKWRMAKLIQLSGWRRMVTETLFPCPLAETLSWRTRQSTTWGNAPSFYKMNVNKCRYFWRSLLMHF